MLRKGRRQRPQSQTRRFAKNHPKHLIGSGAERHANANFGTAVHIVLQRS
jgi:hypothetical protein